MDEALDFSVKKQTQLPPTTPEHEKRCSPQSTTTDLSLPSQALFLAVKNEAELLQNLRSSTTRISHGDDQQSQAPSSTSSPGRHDSPSSSSHPLVPPLPPSFFSALDPSFAAAAGLSLPMSPSATAAVSSLSSLLAGSAAAAAAAGLFPFSPGLVAPDSPFFPTSSSTLANMTSLHHRRRRNNSFSSSETGDSAVKKPKPVPDEKKDEAYWDRRRKNNEAAKRSRDNRRVKEEEVACRATILEQENMKLRAEVAILKNETAKLHFMLFSHCQPS